MRTIRFRRRAACAALCLLLAGTAAYGVPTVKISLSAEDPNVHSREHSNTEPITFYYLKSSRSVIILTTLSGTMDFHCSSSLRIIFSTFLAFIDR